MDIGEKIRFYKELGETIEELEEQKKALSLSILEEMTEKTLTTSDCMVRKYTRLNIKTPLEEARSLNAIKMTETVDKEKIKQLLEQGETITGISEIQYIQVFPLYRS